MQKSELQEIIESSKTKNEVLLRFGKSRSTLRHYLEKYNLLSVYKKLPNKKPKGCEASKTKEQTLELLNVETTAKNIREFSEQQGIHYHTPKNLAKRYDLLYEYEMLLRRLKLNRSK